MTRAGRIRSAGNTLRNAMRPGYARVMVGKVLHRGSGSREGARAAAWVAEHRTNPAAYCTALDAGLWAEAREFGEGLRARAASLREETGLRVGGGARFELLYFLTRRHRPEVVVETGVAAGYSSAAFLAALDRNGSGRLYSSDFPYFREGEPERRVGILVPEDLRDRWTLLLAGDRANLPEILRSVEAIDLFHYDSDKTYAGRRFAMDLVEPRLRPGAVVLMDDIQDNLYFRDLVTARGLDYVVFGHGKAGVGAVGVEAPEAAAETAGPAARAGTGGTNRTTSSTTEEHGQ